MSEAVKEYIYDFGRYGRIKPETIGLITLTGSSSPRGEGILKVWSSFQAYIADENKQGIGSTHSRVTYDYCYKVLPYVARMAFNASDYKKPNYLFLPSNLHDYLEMSPAIKADIKTSYKAK